MGEQDFDIMPLNRISPSSYSALKRCPFKVVLANSLENPLLPYSPKNHLGNVIHTCLQFISQNKISSTVEFDNEWDKLVKREEEKLVKAGFHFYIPLKENVEGYTIKKLQTKALIKKKLTQKSYQTLKNSDTEILTEKWLESVDGNIGGMVDLIYKSENCIKISDFKTGKIFEEEGEIKRDYQDQLKLYAYLYKEEYKVYPDKLSIIDLEKQEYFIDFTPQECEHLARNSKTFLFELKQLIKEENFTKLAKPEIENCSNCLYRPACKFYWKFKTEHSDSPFIDINGKLAKIKQFNNGDINAHIIHDGEILKIYHIRENFKSFLSKNIDKTIAVFNLKQISEYKYQAIKTTKIYEFHK